MMTALIAMTLFLIALLLPGGCGKDQARETDGGGAKDTTAPAPSGDNVINMCDFAPCWVAGSITGDGRAMRIPPLLSRDGTSIITRWNHHPASSTTPGGSSARRARAASSSSSSASSTSQGGDRQTAEANLERNKGIIDEVVEAFRQQAGQVLLLGNALPVVQSSCDQWMVENQRAYNDYLNEPDRRSPPAALVSRRPLRRLGYVGGLP